MKLGEGKRKQSASERAQPLGPARVRTHDRQNTHVERIAVTPKTDVGRTEPLPGRR